MMSLLPLSCQMLCDRSFETRDGQSYPRRREHCTVTSIAPQPDIMTNVIKILAAVLLVAQCAIADDKWRNDGRCGRDWPVTSGVAGECNPNSEFPCCSSLGWCGNTPSHCDCKGCMDFRLKQGNQTNTVVDLKGSNGWPSFSSLWRNYPHEKSEALIKKCKLPNWLIGANSCAIRVSYSFIASGRKFNDIQKGECNWAQVVNGDGDKYIIRVATMRCYMDSRKGPADIVSSSQSAFTGSKGLIVFQDCNFATATGHVDLWDGSKCAGTCYFSNCSNIRLFKF